MRFKTDLHERVRTYWTGFGQNFNTSRIRANSHRLGTGWAKVNESNHVGFAIYPAGTVVR